LNIPTNATWNFNSYNSEISETEDYTFTKETIGNKNVPTTVVTNNVNNSFFESKALAVSMDKGLYSLRFQEIEKTPAIHAEPILQIPADITQITTWNILDGTLANNIVGLGKIESNNIISPAGYSGTVEISHTYYQLPLPVPPALPVASEIWHSHFRILDGLLDEYETINPEYWMRNDINPDISPG
jgi:hypothetical protein